MHKLLLVVLGVACYFSFGYFFPTQPDTVVQCNFSVNAPEVRITAEEMVDSMVPVAVVNGRRFYYQEITHNIVSGPYVITFNNQGGYFRPFKEGEKAGVDISTLPSCVNSIADR